MGGRRRGTREDQHAVGRGAGPRAPGCRSRPSSCPRPGPAPRCGRRSAGSDGDSRRGRGLGSVSGAVGIEALYRTKEHAGERRQRKAARRMLTEGCRDDRARSRARHERRVYGRRTAVPSRPGDGEVFSVDTTPNNNAPLSSGHRPRRDAKAGSTPKSAGSREHRFEDPLAGSGVSVGSPRRASDSTAQAPTPHSPPREKRILRPESSQGAKTQC